MLVLKLVSSLLVVLVSVVDDDDDQNESNVAGISDYYMCQRDMPAFT
jgi:hypothetical protein